MRRRHSESVLRGAASMRRARGYKIKGFKTPRVHLARVAKVRGFGRRGRR